MKPHYVIAFGYDDGDASLIGRLVSESEQQAWTDSTTVARSCNEGTAYRYMGKDVYVEDFAVFEVQAGSLEEAREGTLGVHSELLVSSQEPYLAEDWKVRMRA